MLKSDEQTLNRLIRIAVISAKRMRGRLATDLTNMEHQIHEELVALEIVAGDTNDGRVGQILILDID